MSFKRIKNLFRKCKDCKRYYNKTCIFDGIFPKWWYKNKKCRYEKRQRMKKFDIFLYKTDGCLGFPVELDFYYRYTGEKIGFIEIYRNGTIYTDIFYNNAINIESLKKILKIVNRERIKRIIMTRIKWGKE